MSMHHTLPFFALFLALLLLSGMFCLSMMLHALWEDLINTRGTRPRPQ